MDGVFVVTVDADVFSVHPNLADARDAAEDQGLGLGWMAWGSTTIFSPESQEFRAAIEAGDGSEPVLLDLPSSLVSALDTAAVRAWGHRYGSDRRSVLVPLRAARSELVVTAVADLLNLGAG